MNWTTTMPQRHAAKVDHRGPTECWPWTGQANEDGYGRIRRGARGDGCEYAHRVAWVLAFGPIPDGLTVDHTCVNPPCCNPAHLQLVTLAENSGLAKRRWTHCQKGHVFTEANTYRRREGRRQCRTCARDRKRARA